LTFQKINLNHTIFHNFFISTWLWELLSELWNRTLYKGTLVTNAKKKGHKLQMSHLQNHLTYFNLIKFNCSHKRQDKSVKQMDTGWMTGAQFLTITDHHIPTVSGTCHASFIACTRVSLAGLKWPEHKTDHLSPSNAEV
jgi:hypothetical protein